MTGERKLPDPELVRRLVHYCPETGHIHWMPRDVGHFSSLRLCKTWNTRFAGKRAFATVNDDGYLVGWILGFKIRAHHIAMAVAYGAWPEHEVDHKNGDRSDNRLENLRHATRAQNALNTGGRASRSSPYVGVSFKTGRGWRARATINSVKQHIGYFSTEIEAAKARQKVLDDASCKWSRRVCV